MWTSPKPSFDSPWLSMSNLHNQQGIHSALHPDGLTISIISSQPPVHMVLDTNINSITGIGLSFMQNNFFGYCMGIIPSISQIVLCGGHLLGGSDYSSDCFKWSIDQKTSPERFTALEYRQSGCSIAPHKDGFFLVPGYLAKYAKNGGFPVSTVPNPDVVYYNLVSGSTTYITNNQGIVLPTLVHMSTTVISDSDTAIFFGGFTNSSYATDSIFILNFAHRTWLMSFLPVTTPPGSCPTLCYGWSLIIGIVSILLCVVLCVGISYLVLKMKNHDRDELVDVIEPAPVRLADQGRFPARQNTNQNPISGLNEMPPASNTNLTTKSQALNPDQQPLLHSNPRALYGTN